MKQFFTSDTTGKTYSPEDCVRLLNLKQVLFYMLKGVEIKDFYPSKDYKTQEPILVFLVDKKESRPFYEQWYNQSHNRPEES